MQDSRRVCADSRCPGHGLPQMSGLGSGPSPHILDPLKAAREVLRNDLEQEVPFSNKDWHGATAMRACFLCTSSGGL